MLIGSGSNMSPEKYQKQPHNGVRRDQPGIHLLNLAADVLVPTLSELYEGYFAQSK